MSLGDVCTPVPGLDVGGRLVLDGGRIPFDLYVSDLYVSRAFSPRRSTLVFGTILSIR
jgi:hypothetical protein